MKDIQFISFVDSLQVVTVEELESRDRTLKVVGLGDFKYAQMVEVNGVRFDDFTIVSDKVIHVPVGNTFPSSVPLYDLRVSVISSRFMNRTGKIRVTFGLTHRIAEIEGLQKLVQQVVKVMLSDPGSNRFLRSEGGGLVQSVGNSLSPDAKTSIAAAVAQAVSVTKEQFIVSQQGARTPLNERLLDLTLQGLSFDEAAFEVTATIRLLTYSGTSAEVPLTL